jgi:hypothetical protein
VGTAVEEFEYGMIERPCQASADCCYDLETEAIARLQQEALSSGNDDPEASVLSVAGGRKPQLQNNEKTRRLKKPVRRNEKYNRIDDALKEVGDSRPRTQEEIFNSLDERHIVIPLAEPFVTAGGWMAGFRRDSAAARAWLSKRWTELKLPPLPRGPKAPRE